MAKITAISSLGWTHYTLYEALPVMAKLGFERIDISSFFDYCRHFNSDGPQPRELREMLDKRSTQAICLNYVPELYYAWEDGAVDRFSAAYEAKMKDLAAVGIPMMVMHFGLANERDDIEQQMATVVKAYNRMGRIAEACHIRILIEAPHMYGLLSTVERVRWILDRLESPNIGVLVDSSHWGVIGYDIDELFKMLGDRLWHINLRDSSGNANGPYDLEQTPGDGEVNFRKLADALDRCDYKGDVTTEFEYRDILLDAIEREYRKGLICLEQAGWQLPQTVKTAIGTALVY